jgi:hypothetical protein
MPVAPANLRDAIGQSNVESLKRENVNLINTALQWGAELPTVEQPFQRACPRPSNGTNRSSQQFPVRQVIVVPAAHGGVVLVIEERFDPRRFDVRIAKNNVEATLMTFWRGLKILLRESGPIKTVSIDPQQGIALDNVQGTARAIFYALYKPITERNHVSGNF